MRSVPSSLVFLDFTYRVSPYLPNSTTIARNTQSVLRQAPILALSLFVSLGTQPVLAQVETSTTLGAAGNTDLQKLTGDGIQMVCGGFLANGGADGIDQSAPNAALQAELFDKCGEMVHTANRLEGNDGPTAKDLGLTAEELHSALQNVAAEEAAAIGSTATEFTANQASNVSKRLAALLSVSTGFTLSSANLSGGPIQIAGLGGGGASADIAGSGWGAFVNGIFGTGTKDETDGEDGFDSSSAGITVGADYRLSGNYIVGTALGFNTISSDFDVSTNVSGGDFDITSTTVSAFGLVIGDSWFADAIVSFGTAEFDLDRRIVIGATEEAEAAGNNSTDVVASTNTDSTHAGISASAGSEFSIADNTLFATYARIAYSDVEVDGYEETGGGALALRVDSQSITSLTGAFGFRIAHAISTSYGVISPQFNFEVVHEFEDDSREITSVYIHDPRETPLIAITDDPDRDYFTANGSVSAVFRNGWQGFVDTKILFGLDDVSEAVVTLGARTEF